MPELRFRYGYAFALVLMALTGGGLWWYFKSKGWLE
jgi:magnesium transporter